MNASENESLELLLDTITNTFGGILFLAMLVVIVLQLTSNKSTPAPPEPKVAQELNNLHSRLIATKSQRDALQRTLAIQNQLMDQLATEKDRADLEELQVARATQEELKSKQISLAAELAARQTEINDLAQAMKDTDDLLAIKQAEAASAAKELQRERDSRSTTARLPRLRETTKAEIGLVLRYDRLYLVHHYDRDLRNRVINTDDMIIVGLNDDSLTVTPKPYAGINIDGSEGMRSAVQTLLSPFPKERVYFAIAVWEDSFDVFIKLKDVLVTMGYEYRILPIERGGVISEQSGVTPKVQ